jgi:alanyl-tRNA synthetase
MSLEQATQKGALAFFGDKYKPDKVRMVAVDEFSKELCGGTHVANTGQIGLFKIIELASPAAGLKRIVAITGFKALEFAQNVSEQVKGLSLFFNKKPEQLLDAVEKQRLEHKETIDQLSKIKKEYSKVLLETWALERTMVCKTPIVVMEIEPIFSENLSEIAQLLSQKITGACFLTVKDGQTTRFACALDSSTGKSLSAFVPILKQEKGFGFGLQNTVLQGGGQLNVERIAQLFCDWLSC